MPGRDAHEVIKLDHQLAPQRLSYHIEVVVGIAGNHHLCGEPLHFNLARLEICRGDFGDQPVNESLRARASR